MQSGYAPVNGLNLYYEIHGEGRPLLLLHGAFGTAGMWEAVLPTLVQSRQVIITEVQGHGHTGDVDRPLRFDSMGDDAAALLQHLNIPQADVFGYSMGGTVAVALAVRHPESVGKLAILGSITGPMQETYEPENFRQFQSITPETFNYAPVVDAYARVAPNPANFPVLVRKIVEMGVDFQGFAADDLRGVPAPTLIMFGDREGIRLEHALEIYRTIPNAQLAILPGGDHFVLSTNPDRILSLVMPFLDAPAPV